MNKLEITINSVEAMQRFASMIGRAFRGGEVIELSSDIGGGKTTFTKGLAAGLNIVEPVQSPTFTISRVYKGRDNLELHHYDFYRLEEPGIMSAELAESIDVPSVITVIEWAQIVSSVLPEDHISITISVTSENSRRLTIRIPENQYYIFDVINSYKQTKDIA